MQRDATLHRLGSDESRFHAFVGRLYQAAVGEDDWESLAPALARLFGAPSAVLKLHGTRVDLLTSTDNLQIAPSQREWADHWHRNDLWVQRSLQHGQGAVVTSQRLVSRAAFERSGFYQDWTRSLGIYHMVGTVWPADADTTGVIGVHRPRRAAAFSAIDERRVARLRPHLRHALSLRLALAPQRPMASALPPGSGRFAEAALLLDADGRLLEANPAAEACLRDRSGLVACAGRIAPRDAALAPRWRRLLRDAAAGTCTGMALARAGRPPLTVLTAPLQDPRGSQPGVLVLIRDPQARRPDVALLRSLFGLSATEARVAAALAEGASTAVIGQQMNIGPGTVRTHLKAILAKSECHRQAEFVSLVTRSIAMLAARSCG